MQNAKYDSTIQKAVASVGSAEPTIELRSYSAAGTDLARVVIDVTHTQASRAEPQVVLDALGKKLQGRFQAVAGSFKSVERGAYTERLVGVVGRVREIIALGDNPDLKGFRAMASNMFMDEEKDMWQMKKTEAGSVLIKTSAEDDVALLNLLEATASAGYRSSPEYGRLSAMCSALASQVQGGDYVSYVTADNTLSMGFVVATTDSDSAFVLPQDAENAEEVNLSAVTEIHDQSDFPEVKQTPEEIVEQEVAISSGRVSPEMLVNYYKKIFFMNPKFFAEFEKRIRGHQFA